MAQDAYVFGYGSLIEEGSRTRTNPEVADVQPARVTGYQRGWFHQFGTFRMKTRVKGTCQIRPRPQLAWTDETRSVLSSPIEGRELTWSLRVLIVPAHSLQPRWSCSFSS